MNEPRDIIATTLADTFTDWLRRADMVIAALAEDGWQIAPASVEVEATATLGEAAQDDMPTPTITAEAESAVYGDRGAAYGHPRQDFTRCAVIWTGLLHGKLADGAYIEPEDVGRCMIGLKLARDVHSIKRDNRVDIAGFALCLDRLVTGQ